MEAAWEWIKAHWLWIVGGVGLYIVWSYLRSASSSSSTYVPATTADPNQIAANSADTISQNQTNAQIATAQIAAGVTNAQTQAAADVANTSAAAAVSIAQINATGAVDLANANAAPSISLATLNNANNYVAEELTALTRLGSSYAESVTPNGSGQGPLFAFNGGFLSLPGTPNPPTTQVAGGLTPTATSSLFQNIISQVSAIVGVAPAQTTPSTTAPTPGTVTATPSTVHS